MSLRAPTKAGMEPIPGYTLRKRLGAGGYGEVWLADAPGGLQKAIKLIFGTVDQSHASSELRSLQRIRQVYHPFLLSIERVEIVDNQVVIVTELAESSLLDRFEQCRRRGAQGIGRSQLLDFMKDAADALDFLSQKHALQHLDIKPGNLLIIADRIKVGDFGLIKDLHDQNQSLVSGLTPTYSAPEIFDGRPDYRSDQYSLAIVYMEMLTGRVPFSGKTTGELARQHLTQSPELDSLPPADRAVVGRALAKNPLDRYATCRIFVEQLLKTRSAVLPVQPASNHASATENSVEPISTADDRKTSTASALSDRQTLHSALDTSGLANHWTNSRAMFVGLGGIGCQALLQLRHIASSDCDNRLDWDDHAWAAIDTDPKSLDAVTAEELDCHVASKDAFELRIFTPSAYRDAAPELFVPLSRRWLYNIPRSLRTEGVRPLAILSFLHHYEGLRARIASQLAALIQQHIADEDNSEPLRIYVFSSMHGGTGSALLAEMGFLIRRILNEKSFSDYRLCALMSAATTTHNHSANLYSAAGLATLSELSYLMDENNEVASIHYSDNVHSVSNVKPFDWVTLIDGGMHGVSADIERTSREMANVAWLDSQSMLGAALNDTRLSCRAEQNGWVYATTSAPINITANVNATTLARWCCEQTLSHVLPFMVGPKGSGTNFTRPPSSSNRAMATASGDFPLTTQACSDFSARLLNEMAIGDPNILSTESTRAMLFDIWTSRLSDSQEVLNAQLAHDLMIWKNLFGRIIKTKVYNWRQVEHIQLKTIEAIVDYSEGASAELAQQLSSGVGKHRLATSAAAVAQYLKLLSEQCLLFLQVFQREGRQLSKKIASWCESIKAEKSLNESAFDASISGLSPNLQSLANRVNAVLESTVHNILADSVGFTAGEKDVAGHSGGSIPANFNLTYMLSIASELVVKLSNEMGITDEDFSQPSENSDPTVSFKQIESLSSVLTQCGGRAHRFVVLPSEQEQIAVSLLEKAKLSSTTSLLRCRRSQRAFILLEAENLKLQQLCSSLWRPCPQTLHLAERLRTRIDVEWKPASMLLEVNLADHDISNEALALPDSITPLVGNQLTPNPTA